MADYSGFPEWFFERADDRGDDVFYRPARLVTHIDDGAVAAVGALYDELGLTGRVLDLMSSWVSHFRVPPKELVVLGMNAEELAANPAATERIVHDLNADPRIPVPDEDVDGVVCCVSVDYLIRPVEVLAEAARVLRPGGRLVAIHGVPIADPDDMTAAVAPLDPYMGLADEADRLDPLAAAAGFRLLSRESASPFQGGMTPEEYAQSIESRMWSFLTGLDDETWARVVEPSIAALRALPEPDRPREQTWRVNLAVFTTGD